MINLLPTQQKKELFEQWRLRLTFILGIILLAFFTSLFLLLFLAKTFIGVDLQTEKIKIEEYEKTITLNQNLETEIIESNKFLSKINSFYKKTSDFSSVLEKINNNLAPGTYLTLFNMSSFEQGKEEKIKISISGYCDNRNKLLELKNDLEREDSFLGVLFSPQSWVTPTEIDFSVTFELNQTTKKNDNEK